MMAADTAAESEHPAESSFLSRPIPALTRMPLPLFMLQPVLGRIVRHVARKRPELFNRIGPHKNKSFMIDPLNMPFVLMLRPDPDAPALKAVRRNRCHQYDARIAGSFLTLLDMVDGWLDGDALFFSRDLLVEGDTEATVCLRNALDDLDGSIADDIADMFGPPGRITLGALRRIRSHDNER